MGAWKELDTDLEIKIDTSDLDMVIQSFGGDDVFSDVVDKCERTKKAISEASIQAVDDLSKTVKSFQEDFINKNCKHPTGMLASSIDAEKVSDYHYIIGTRINHIYPMSLEYGHKDIYPIRAKALVFAPPPDWKGPMVTTGKFAGKVVLRKVNATKPRPFVKPAYEKTLKVADKIVLGKLGELFKTYGLEE